MKNDGGKREGGREGEEKQAAEEGEKEKEQNRDKDKREIRSNTKNTKASKAWPEEHAHSTKYPKSNQR